MVVSSFKGSGSNAEQESHYHYHYHYSYSLPTGYYGSNPGYYGSNPGYYGSNAGYYGSNPGYYGSNPGYYGSNPGYYGSNPGYYGSNPGYYGSNAGYYSYDGNGVSDGNNYDENNYDENEKNKSESTCLDGKEIKSETENMSVPTTNYTENMSVPTTNYTENMSVPTTNYTENMSVPTTNYTENMSVPTTNYTEEPGDWFKITFDGSDQVYTYHSSWITGDENGKDDFEEYKSNSLSPEYENYLNIIMKNDERVSREDYLYKGGYDTAGIKDDYELTIEEKSNEVKEEEEDYDLTMEEKRSNEVKEEEDEEEDYDLTMDDEPFSLNNRYDLAEDVDSIQSWEQIELAKSEDSFESPNQTVVLDISKKTPNAPKKSGGRRLFSKFKQGEQVEMKWDGYWYLGTIVGMNSQSFKYSVEVIHFNEDGTMWWDVEKEVPELNLRPKSEFKSEMDTPLSSAEYFYDGVWYTGEVFKNMCDDSINFKYINNNKSNGICFDISADRLRFIAV